MAWQKRHGYGRRSLVETAISRIKAINGGRLTARTFAAQRNEVAIHVAIANKAIQLAKPVTVRVGIAAGAGQNCGQRGPCTKAPAE